MCEPLSKGSKNGVSRIAVICYHKEINYLMNQQHFYLSILLKAKIAIT